MGGSGVRRQNHQSTRRLNVLGIFRTVFPLRSHIDKATRHLTYHPRLSEPGASLRSTRLGGSMAGAERELGLSRNSIILCSFTSLLQSINLVNVGTVLWCIFCSFLLVKLCRNILENSLQTKVFTIFLFFCKKHVRCHYLF